MPPETILFVDGNTTLMENHKRFFESLGYEVRVVATVNEALELLRSQEAQWIDLVVSDIVLPGGMNGSELLARILDMELRIPVIFYTEISSYRYDYTIMAAQGFVEKGPDGLGKLNRAIERLFSPGS